MIRLRWVQPGGARQAAAIRGEVRISPTVPAALAAALAAATDLLDHAASSLGLSGGLILDAKQRMAGRMI